MIVAYISGKYFNIILRDHPEGTGGEFRAVFLKKIERLL